MTLSDITEWILGALLGIVMLLLGNVMRQTQRDKQNLQDADSTLHERISNEQKRINDHAERLRGVEVNQISLKDQLNRIEQKFDTAVEKMDKKLDALIARRLER